MTPNWLGFDWGAPIISARSSSYGVFPSNFTVGQSNGDQLSEVCAARILAVRHFAVDINDSGIFQNGGEEVLLFAFYRSAVPLELYLRQHFAGSQGVVHQRGGFVQGCSKLKRLMNALSRRLARLRVCWDQDGVCLLYTSPSPRDS